MTLDQQTRIAQCVAIARNAHRTAIRLQHKGDATSANQARVLALQSLQQARDIAKETNHV